MFYLSKTNRVNKVLSNYLISQTNSWVKNVLNKGSLTKDDHIFDKNLKLSGNTPNSNPVINYIIISPIIASVTILILYKYLKKK